MAAWPCWGGGIPSQAEEGLPFRSSQAEEGFSVQYCFRPKEGGYETNLRIVASAPNFYRASEILDQLNLAFKKDFRIIKPNLMSEGIAHYAYRQFQEKYKFDFLSESTTLSK